MKLVPTMGNIRIVNIVHDLNGVMLDHAAIAVKHDISVYNFKYLLRRMVDLGIIRLERTRGHNGILHHTICHVLIYPELLLEEGQEEPKPIRKPRKNDSRNSSLKKE